MDRNRIATILLLAALTAAITLCASYVVTVATGTDNGKYIPPCSAGDGYPCATGDRVWLDSSSWVIIP